MELAVPHLTYVVSLCDGGQFVQRNQEIVCCCLCCVLNCLCCLSGSSCRLLLELMELLWQDL